MKLSKLVSNTITPIEVADGGLREDASNDFMIRDIALAEQYIDKLFRTSGKFVYGVDGQGIITVDCTGDLKFGTMTLSGYDLFSNHDSAGKVPIGFRVKFGHVDGNFECNHFFTNGLTLENGPTEVNGYVHLAHCHLVTTEHLPKKINGSLTIDRNGKLTSLEYIPEGTTGFYANDCYRLQHINGKFDDLEDYDLQISDSKLLNSLDFVPNSIGGDLFLSGNFTGEQISELFGRLKQVGYSNSGEIRFVPNNSSVSGPYNVSRLPMISDLYRVVLPNGDNRGQTVELAAIINGVLSDIAEDGVPRRKATMSMQRKLLDANLGDYLK